MYPTWAYYPRNANPPEWVPPFIDVFTNTRSTIDSTRAGAADGERRSDAVLAQLGPGLELLGYEVESGKKKAQKIRRPVLYGDNGQPRVTYEIDAFHDQLGVAVEVEAGRGAQNGADYRDIVRTSLLLDARYLALGMPIEYRFKSRGKEAVAPAFKNTHDQLDAIYASQRLHLPFEGVLLVGY